ncbi:hypothetical protein LL033_14230 [Clostridium estertheticum]|uniref:hypothetical protein n=1 Tax=Clostridium estertheticum TaxID=238834 RepID=UPI001C0C2779|nr:hypothetical protein [Clostridium estertheticum]MBU3213934.1 hypothetical protein [Clostridium estertheticum]WAG53812.1 hypothetical protein LL033_14230 [Clostridium estertheticum]
MSKLKEILVYSMIVAMLSSPVTAIEVAKYSVPDFSIMIGNRLYTLEYANDKKDESEITNAIAGNIGDIYIKTTGDNWIDNSTGGEVAVSTISKLDVKFFNGVAVETPPVKKGSIIFKSVDVDTNLQLGNLVYRTGDIGTVCEGYANVIDGYTFVSAETTFTGKFASLDQPVTLNYKKQNIIANVAPATTVTGITANQMFNESDKAYVLVQAVDEDKETTNIRVSLDGVEIANLNKTCMFQLNTQIVGGHVLKINSVDKQGLVGEERTFVYIVR